MRLAALRRDPSGKPKGVVIVAIILSDQGSRLRPSVHTIVRS